MKMEEERKTEKETLDKLVNDYEQSNKTNDKVVKENLNQQHQKLREKIYQRSNLQWKRFVLAIVSY